MISKVKEVSHKADFGIERETHEDNLEPNIVEEK